MEITRKTMKTARKTMKTARETAKTAREAIETERETTERERDKVIEFFWGDGDTQWSSSRSVPKTVELILLFVLVLVLSIYFDYI